MAKILASKYPPSELSQSFLPFLTRTFADSATSLPQQASEAHDLAQAQSRFGQRGTGHEQLHSPHQESHPLCCVWRCSRRQGRRGVQVHDMLEVAAQNLTAETINSSQIKSQRLRRVKETRCSPQPLSSSRYPVSLARNRITLFCTISACVPNAAKSACWIFGASHCRMKGLLLGDVRI